MATTLTSTGVTFSDATSLSTAPLGMGSTWYDEKTNRAVGTWYQNNSNVVRFLFIHLSTSGNALYANTSASDTNRICIGAGEGDSGEWKTFYSPIPPGWWYKAEGGTGINHWSELR